MKGISSVLCAVDIAEPGHAAFAQALALARSHDAKLLIVHGVSLATLGTEQVRVRATGGDFALIEAASSIGTFHSEIPFPR